MPRRLPECQVMMEDIFRPLEAYFLIDYPGTYVDKNCTSCKSDVKSFIKSHLKMDGNELAVECTTPRANVAFVEDFDLIDGNELEYSFSDDEILLINDSESHMSCNHKLCSFSSDRRSTEEVAYEADISSSEDDFNTTVVEKNEGEKDEERR